SKISVAYLKRIEDGDWDFLPLPYVRSFMQTYARIVGLDVAEVLSEFDQITEPARKQIRKTQVQELKDQSSGRKGELTRGFVDRDSYGPSSSFSGKMRRAFRYFPTRIYVFGAVALGIAVLVIITLTIFFNDNPQDVEEIAFDQTVREHNEMVGESNETSGDTLPAIQPSKIKQEIPKRSQVVTEKKDTTIAQPELANETTLVQEKIPPPVVSADDDSLRLVARAIGQCYIRVNVDGSEDALGDVVLWKDNELTFAAESSFKVILGNAGNMQLFLGDKDLGVPGELEQVMIVWVNETGIRRTYVVPPKKQESEESTTPAEQDSSQLDSTKE
ncbi:helix-turn-helix domain-containing protein, partial [bacterium]|nr:helix-turn-helix domain-containing protein [bacterium]